MFALRVIDEMLRRICEMLGEEPHPVPDSFRELDPQVIEKAGMGRGVWRAGRGRGTEGVSNFDCRRAGMQSA
jgi:hypothetical protein